MMREWVVCIRGRMLPGIKVSTSVVMQHHLIASRPREMWRLHGADDPNPVVIDKLVIKYFNSFHAEVPYRTTLYLPETETLTPEFIPSHNG
jgi:hypothetical protein